MYCPRDGQALVEYLYKKVPIDCCSYCNGAWLDKDELARITNKDKDILMDHGSLENIPQSRFKCPRCQGSLVITHYTQDKEVEIDLCAQCGGIWLDTDELKEILKLSLEAR